MSGPDPLYRKIYPYMSHPAFADPFLPVSHAHCLHTDILISCWQSLLGPYMLTALFHGDYVRCLHVRWPRFLLTMFLRRDSSPLFSSRAPVRHFNSSPACPSIVGETLSLTVVHSWYCRGFPNLAVSIVCIKLGTVTFVGKYESPKFPK